MEFGLTPEQLGIIKSILQPYMPPVTDVKVFGSRATGRYKPYSDVDLALYGEGVTDAVQHRLKTLFEESPLPMRVDVQAYHLIEHPPLKLHIDGMALSLFTPD